MVWHSHKQGRLPWTTDAGKEKTGRGWVGSNLVVIVVVAVALKRRKLHKTLAPHLRTPVPEPQSKRNSTWPPAILMDRKSLLPVS